MRRDANRIGGLKERQGRDGGGREKVTEGMGGMGQDMGWEGTGRERRKGRKREERATVPELKFIAPPLHDRRESTRFTSDLDHPFRKSWIHH